MKLISSIRYFLDEAGLFIITLLFILVEHSITEHIIIGEPPSFLPNGEPQDKVVSSLVFNSAGGVMANLVLPCRVNGTPTPTISWYRESTRLDAQFVTSDGTLAINVMEGVDVTRTGVLYHCEATNIIGINNFPATLRSRDVNVSYTFFDGFSRRTDTTIDVSVIRDQAVGLECDFLLSNPLPVIEWRDNNGVVPEILSLNQVLYLEGGRYLFIRKLTTAQISQIYRCVTTQLLLTGKTIISPTTYTLSSNLLTNTLTEYKPLGTVIGILGMKVNLYYVAASHDGTRMNNDPTTTLGVCGSAQVINDLVVQIDMVPEPIGGDRYINISCGVFGTGITSQSPTVMGTIIIADPVRIIAPPEGDPELLSRELLVGDESRTYTCGVTGIPAPSVTWYFNGAPASGVDGLTVNQNVLDIAAPQVSHSGIYQCFAKNAYGQVMNDVQKQWLLEFRAASAPRALPLRYNNTLAVEDQFEGNLIVVDEGTLNFEVIIVVNADPCPMVEWTFEGSVITDRNVYFNDPCPISYGLTDNFTITIANLTTATSGRYLANFTNLGGFLSLPIYITVPEAQTILSLDINLNGNLNFSCLLSGSNLTMTCVTSGFPRPVIRFFKDSRLVNPGAAGFERFTKIDFGQIRITEIAMEDEGLYSCDIFLTNILLPIPLYRQYCSIPVIIDLNTTPTNPKAGDTLKLGCVFEGNPTPMVTWTRNGEQFLGNSDGTVICSDGLITIGSVTMNDSGVYECILTNGAASITQSVTVEIESTDQESSTFANTLTIIGTVSALLGVALVIVSCLLIITCILFLVERHKRVSGSN